MFLFLITFVKGNLLESNAVALVITVNTIGVMGKGIALQFEETFTLNNKEYLKACKEKLLVPGKLVCVWDNSLQTGVEFTISNIIFYTFFTPYKKENP